MICEVEKNTVSKDVVQNDRTFKRENQKKKETIISQDSLYDKQDLFWRIWSEHQTAVLLTCNKLCRNSFDAEDLCSQVLLKAYEQLPLKVNSIKSLSAWFYVLTKNLFIDQRRSQDRIKKQFDTFKGVEYLPAEIFTGLKNQELFDYVQSLIDSLPNKLHLVSKAFFMEEKKYREIAYEMDLAETIVRKRIQLARQILIPSLRQYLRMELH